MCLRRRRHRRRRRRGHPRRAQRLLHRRLVPAQPGGVHGRARDRARFPHLRRGHGVRLDGGLEPVHPQLVLDPAHRAGHRLDVGNRGHLLVVVQPALELIVEAVDGVLADPDHGRAGLGQSPRELPLVGREERFHEDDVHVWNGNHGLTTAPWPPRSSKGYVLPMVVAGFVAPYLLDATTRFVEAAAGLPGTELAVITCDPADRLPERLKPVLAGHWRIDDPLDPGQIAAAVQGLSSQLGPVQCLMAVLEQLQVPMAQVREQLGIGGMDPVTAGNFRDKDQMKTVLRAAGVLCARHRLARSATDARDFATVAGFPLVVKPPAGAGAQSTFRLDDPGDLEAWLEAAPPSPDSPAQIEEFLTGDEGSYDSVMIDGQVVWDSVSDYLPTPLEVLRHPWMQWVVRLPRDIGPEYDAIRR